MKIRIPIFIESDDNDDNEDNSVTPEPSKQKLRIAYERKGRGGKEVTLINGFKGTDDDLQELARLVKSKCGVGGTAKDGQIIIQGDHRTKLIDILKKAGYADVK